MGMGMRLLSHAKLALDRCHVDDVTATTALAAFALAWRQHRGESAAKDEGRGGVRGERLNDFQGLHLAQPPGPRINAREVERLTRLIELPLGKICEAHNSWLVELIGSICAQ